VIKMPGTNEFNGFFDPYIWSAPVFETPEEVAEEFNRISFSNKTLSCIRFIGSGQNIGACDAQFLSEEETCPRCIEVCEPMQFVFTDGSTFDFQPLEGGGARIACNSIPTEISEGLNQSDFDANMLFGDTVIDAKIHLEEFKEIKTQTTELFNRNGYGELPEPTVSSEYRYIFCLCKSYRFHTLQISQKQEAWYTVLLLPNESHASDLSSEEVRNLRIPTGQIPLFPGFDRRDSYWFFPISKEEDWRSLLHTPQVYARFPLCVWLDEEQLLSDLLLSYFRDEDQASWYDGLGINFMDANLYSFETMTEIIRRLRQYAAPSDRQTEYLRIAECFENMLRVPSCDSVLFLGPDMHPE